LKLLDASDAKGTNDGCPGNVTGRMGKVDLSQSPLSLAFIEQGKFTFKSRDEINSGKGNSTFKSEENNPKKIKLSLVQDT
jgi:hypothetical protein